MNISISFISLLIKKPRNYADLYNAGACVGLRNLIGMVGINIYSLVINVFRVFLNQHFRLAALHLLNKSLEAVTPCNINDSLQAFCAQTFAACNTEHLYSGI